jgi:hypothetical protein
MRGNIERKLFMRIREDSPFHGITELQKEQMLDDAEKEVSHDDIAEDWEQLTGIETTGGQVKRFLRRLRYERAIRETDESAEDWEGFAARAADGKARDGLIEASRQQLFEEALAEGKPELLLELYKTANEERARERELAVAQRKAAVAEENAKIGWRRLEWQKAASAVKLLPKLREVLTEGSGSAEERLAQVRAILMVGGGELLEEGGSEKCRVESAE